VIAPLVNGLALFLIVAWIAIESILRLLEPRHVDAWPMLWIATLGGLSNVIVFAILNRAVGTT
jgi:cobalt-zinc-cadmium efflux system protein